MNVINIQKLFYIMVIEKKNNNKRQCDTGTINTEETLCHKETL